jgi:U3 small nucleolar RNA-associated protein 21
MTGWESVITGHKGDPWARTWFWGRKKAGRWAFHTGDGSPVSAVAISPCGTFALIGSEQGGIDMFNLQSGLRRQRFPSKLTPAQARQAKLQQLRQLDDVTQIQTRSKSGFAPGTGRHKAAVTGIVVDSMNKLVISCSRDGTIKFWEFVTGMLQHEIGWIPTTAITGCRYHPASELIAVSCEDHSIRVVDIETKRTIREFHGSNGPINDFCFSNDGRWIVGASQDSLVRVWDLPTSHLIDAFRMEKPCKALAFSSSGEYLAAATEGELGVQIWTNRTLFKHVPTKQISDSEAALISGPTTSGEGGEGLFEAAFDEEATPEDEATVGPSLVDQISSDMMTLSLVPKSRWQTLLHLDLIKQRNKPKEAPKVPEKAPFFLTAVGGQSQEKSASGETELDTGSRITKFDRNRSEQAFTARLAQGSVSGDCKSTYWFSDILTAVLTDPQRRRPLH